MKTLIFSLLLAIPLTACKDSSSATPPATPQEPQANESATATVTSPIPPAPGPSSPIPISEVIIDDQPGAIPFSDDLRSRLAETVAGRHPAEAPRTRHIRDNGLPTYSNRLALENSPYLLQHAHNPVNWFPWGDEAFLLAQELDRPIFMSVGYSTCHWCHVMEEESFEDVEIATFINENYIAIKVDREQRPDVDDIYMTAVRLLTRRGGWPMTIVMTPDAQPFFGATYIPARDGDRGSRSGLLTVLNQLRDLYRDNPDEALSRAQQVSTQIARAVQPAPAGDVPGVVAITRAVDSYSERFDAEFGGIGGAPKFPQPSQLGLLMRAYRRTGDEMLLRVVTDTLDAMAHGGIYDHIGGGFHRYATDRQWLVPHFEKMLYDNAQLAVVYLEAYQITGREEYARVVRETLDYVAREMTSPEGGFYSATDADSEGEEGLFFVWTVDEIESLLSTDDARLLTSYYNVTERGNFEGRNILNITQPLADVAAELDLSEDDARVRLDEARQVLYRARAERVPPLLDDKVLAGWNGLMISAFARAGLILNEPRYVESASAAGDFARQQLCDDGRLSRSYRDGSAEGMAYLDDYAFLIAGALDLFEVTAESFFLEWAMTLQDTLDFHFADVENGGYFYTADDAEELLARQKPDYDGARPTGNSVSAENLLRLAEFTSNTGYRERAERLFAAFGAAIDRNPQSLPRMLSALDFYLDRPREIVVVAPTSGDDHEAFLQRLRGIYLPNRVLIPVQEGPALEAIERVLPITQYKVSRGGHTTAYVCEAGTCARPTIDPEEFEAQLRPVLRYDELLPAE